MQKGEISLTLSIIAIVISILGVALGSISVQQNLNSSTEAQEGSFPYSSTLSITDVNKNPIGWQSGMTWETQIVGETTSGNIQNPNNQSATFDWLGPAPERFRNQNATIKVAVPQNFEVVDAYCLNITGNTCDNIQKNLSTLTISNLPIVENASISYGWIVKDKRFTCSLKDESCNLTQQSVSIPSVSEPANITLGTKTGCGNFRSEQLKYVIDIYNDSFKVVCGKEVSGTETQTTCRPGIDSHRTLDQTQPEVINKQWQAGVRYTIHIQIADIDYPNSCASKKFSYTFSPGVTNPTAIPTGIPTITPDVTNFPTTIPTISPDVTSFPTAIPTVIPTPIPSIPTSIPACKVQVDNCIPQNIRLWNNSPTENSVRVVWDLPTQCSDYVIGSSDFWVDVVNSSGSIVCPAESKTNNAECMLGSEIPNRLTDTNSPEFKNKKWNPNSQYGIRVYLRARDQSCISDPAEKTFTYINSTNTCEHIKGNGDFRVMFAPQGYDSYTEFKQDVRSAIADIESTNLQEDVLNSMSFITSKDINIDYQCSRSEEIRRLYACEYDTATQVKQSCDADSILIIINDDEWGGAGTFGQNRASLTAVSLSQTAHELGHSIANLYDEYLYQNDENDEPDPSEYDPVRANCTGESDTKCTKWGSTGCFLGCSYTNWSRPSENSNMRNGSREFNLPSLQAWRDAFNNLNQSFFDDSNLNFVYHNAIHLNLDQEAENVLKLSSIQVEQTYPQSPKNNYSEYYYDLNMKDDQNNVLYTTQIPSHDLQAHEILKPTLLTSIHVYLPYIEEADSVIISSNNKDILEISLSEANLSQPSLAGNLCGNSVCDAGNGETANSCAKDCGSHLAKSEDERADLNNDGYVLTNDLSILLDTYQTPDGDINGDGKTNAIDYQIQIQYFGQETLSTLATQARENTPTFDKLSQ